MQHKTSCEGENLNVMIYVVWARQQMYMDLTLCENFPHLKCRQLFYKLLWVKKAVGQLLTDSCILHEERDEL